MKECDESKSIDIVSVKENKMSTSQKKSLYGTIKNKFFRTKLLNVKGVKVLIPLLAILILGVILFDFDSTASTRTSATTKENGINYTSSLEYIETIEKKLSKVLSAISGAGKTQLMISIDSSPIITVASNSEEKSVTTSSGTTTTTTTEPIIITTNGKSQPLILGEVLPEIKGVIVVSSGADDVRVKLDIINAVRTVLGISSEKIDVFRGV